jgi:type I restriction enzyme S subunit
VTGRRLPPGWAEKRLRDVVVPTQRRHPRREVSESFTYIDIDAVDNQRNRVVGPRPVGREEAPSRATNDVRKGDVLFSLVRPYLRNVARVPAELDGAVASSAFCVLRPSDAITTDYLFYAVLRSEFIHKVKTYGESPPSARDDEFLDLEIPVAPEPMQPLVVQSLEAQLSRLDAAEAALSAAATNLRRYRSSVLATEYREALAAGSPQPRLGDLAAESDYGTSQKTTSDAAGPPVLRIPNIAHGALDLTAMKFATQPSELATRRPLRPGDFLVVRTNGSRNLIGRGAVIRSELVPAHYHASYLIRFRLRGDDVTWRWIGLMWDSPAIRRDVQRLAATTAGQYNVSARRLSEVGVPVPDGDLEARVVRLEARLASAQRTAIDCARQRSRLNSLRSAMLHDAYAGRLLMGAQSESAIQLTLEDQLP